ncbi:hypothetical protein AYO38_07930, partial [bacterium SCGC AG-212-C10]
MATATLPPLVFEPAPDGCTEYVSSAPCTWEQFLAFDQEDPGLAEWVDGVVFTYMSTTSDHERLVTFLKVLLASFCEMTRNLGEVLGGPYPMKLVVTKQGRGREPDLMFVRDEHRGRITLQFLDGPADLVIEIVSDDSPRRDNETKLREYSEGGVQEYWILDPRPGRHTAQFFVRSGQSLLEAGLVDGVFASMTMDGFWLRPEWLWESGRKPLATATEIVAGRGN